MKNQIQKKEETEVITPEKARPTLRPAVDVFENEEEVLLVADLPGVSVDRLSVRIEEGELTLEGQWGPADELRPVTREFRPVDYHRTFALPEGIDAEGVKARLKDGVVRIHLPRAEAFRPREVPVSAS